MLLFPLRYIYHSIRLILTLNAPLYRIPCTAYVNEQLTTLYIIPKGKSSCLICCKLLRFNSLRRSEIYLFIDIYNLPKTATRPSSPAPNNICNSPCLTRHQIFGFDAGSIKCSIPFHRFSIPSPKNIFGGCCNSIYCNRLRQKILLDKTLFPSYTRLGEIPEI